MRGGGRIFSSWAGWVDGSKTRGCQESWADYPNWVVICHEGALPKFHWPCPRAFYIRRWGKKFSFLGLVGHKCEQMSGKGHQYSKMQQERYFSFIQGIHLKLGIKGGTPVYMIGDDILVWWSFILWTVHPPTPLKNKKKMSWKVYTLKIPGILFNQTCFWKNFWLTPINFWSTDHNKNIAWRCVKPKKFTYFLWTEKCDRSLDQKNTEDVNFQPKNMLDPPSCILQVHPGILAKRTFSNQDLYLPR